MAMDETADIAALKALYDDYLDAWNRKDLTALVQLFAFPMVVGGNGRAPLGLPDAAAYLDRTGAIMADIESRGWVRSVLDEIHVGMMAAGTAVLTVHYHRARSDGSRLEGGTSNYLARKLDGAWKIVGMIVP